MREPVTMISLACASLGASRICGGGGAWLWACAAKGMRGEGYAGQPRGDQLQRCRAQQGAAAARRDERRPQDICILSQCNRCTTAAERLLSSPIFCLVFVAALQAVPR